MLLTSPALAQRELHWRDMAVQAVLRADGRLEVTERQTMVFAGDWNGGERTFNLRPRQRLDFTGMNRIDSNGTVHSMVEGDLDVVDGYDFTSRSVLRWRSRLPDDPPFNGDERTYELTYSYGNILVGSGRERTLDHDFAFPDRSGVIEHFSLDLSLDSVWQAPPDFVGHYEATYLQPGQGYLVTLPLQYVGTGDAPVVQIGAGVVPRRALAAMFSLALISLLWRLYSHERAKGRFLPFTEKVDEEFLRKHVLDHLPEVIGAAWDNRTNATEVTALLARLVSEGKLRSEVRRGRGIFKTSQLYLELLVARSSLEGYERRLIDALFDSGSTTTDTDSVRKRYKSTGFDPASKIVTGVKQLVEAMTPQVRREKVSFWPTVLLVVSGMALMIVGSILIAEDSVIFAGTTLVTLSTYIVTVGFALWWRNRVHGLGLASLGFLLPLGVLSGALLYILASGVTQGGTVMLAGATLLVLGYVNSVLNMARSRESPDRIILRRRLGAARRYLAQELSRSEPRLRDEWYPWLIGFGLAGRMDRWFRAFGPAVGDGVTIGTSGSPASGGGFESGSTGGWTGFGGGGGFAGGGASASWAAAAGSMAAGIASPGSGGSGGSSGGGGGGGGGSSGGGGGGGW